jgi:thiol-disulfide isomerase/thioredoxin
MSEDMTGRLRASVVAALVLSLAFMSCVVSCRKAQTAGDIFEQNRGKVMVVLLGMKGCPGTEAATQFLVEYAKAKPDGIAICRVDVPPPGQEIAKAEEIAPCLKYVVDNNRDIADRLEFFFYPTLYVIDKDGVVRFSGACEPDKVKTMVSEMLSEVPGGKKKMYTPPMAGVGQIIDDFEAREVDTSRTSLGEMCADTGMLLFFSSTTCPFSVAALDDLEKIRKEFGQTNFNYVIVSFGQGSNEIRDVYAQKSPGTTVVLDGDKKISETYFGVSAVPFMYVLDKDRRVVDRRPFLYGNARTAVAKALGLAVTDSGCGASGAG